MGAQITFHNPSSTDDFAMAVEIGPPSNSPPTGRRWRRHCRSRLVPADGNADGFAIDLDIISLRNRFLGGTYHIRSM